MKKKCFFWLVLITVFLLSSIVIFAQHTWTKFEGNPLELGGVTGEWDKHVYYPKVLYNPDSTRYEMYYSGSFGPEISWFPFRVGAAYSQDGINWTSQSVNPIISPDSGKWDEGTIEVGTVLRENGEYKMWYLGAQLSPALKLGIGYATSPDGINWTKHPDPILTPSTAEWEKDGVATPTVLSDSSGYTMFYIGFGPNEIMQVCRAASVDGINWIKDINNPVLRVGEENAWDRSVRSTSCLYINDTLYMWYGGYPGYSIGEATSTDNGLTWIKNSMNPVIERGPGWDADYIQAPNVMTIGDSLYLWYNGSVANTELWRIGLAKSKIYIDTTTTQITDIPILKFTLEQNFPNPFNPSTIIKYSVPYMSFVTLIVYDILGNEAAALVTQYKQAGSYDIALNAADLPSGIYFYRLQSGGFVQTRKMILLR